MIELPHTVVGATIAIKIGNPALALPLSFLSHFLVDLLPHWNPHIFKEKQKFGKISTSSKTIIVTDSLLSLIIGSLISLRAYPDWGGILTILMACFLAILPDLIEAPYFFAKFKNPKLLNYINFHRHFQVKASFWVGIITQIIVVVVCLYLIFA